MVAFTAHFYGCGDPAKVQEWPSKKIEKWHTEAINIHNEINKPPPESG